MDWYQVSTLVGVGITLAGIMIAMIVWAVTKLDADIKSIGAQVESSNKRLDGHAMRIDQLYNIIVSLLKEAKK